MTTELIWATRQQQQQLPSTIHQRTQVDDIHKHPAVGVLCDMYTILYIYYFILLRVALFVFSILFTVAIQFFFGVPKSSPFGIPSRRKNPT